jgi:glycerophosphoryl diester phosphodiesterase
MGIVAPPLTAARVAAAQRPSLNVYGPSNPLYIAHRAGSLRYLEDCMTGYDAAYADGLRVLEPDCYQLSDGGIAIIHDNTLDRTTTGTGAVSAVSSAQFKDLVIDADTWFGGNPWGNPNPTLLAEMVAKYVGKIIFAPEAKDAGGGQKVVDILTAYGVPKDQALVVNFSLSELAPAVAAGYPALLEINDAVNDSKTAPKAAGVTWVGMDVSVSDAAIAAWVAAGYKVVIYTVNRRWQRDRCLALGVSGFYSDDPEYLSTNLPASNVDSYATAKWPRGVFTSTETTTVHRGKFYTGGYWGWDLSNGVSHNLQGWACPIKGNPNANSFTIYADCYYEGAFGGDTTRWSGIFLADSTMKDMAYDDSGATTENGYLIAFRKSGTITIFKKVAGVASTLATITSTLIADAAEVRYKLTVTPTTITASRLNTDGTVAATGSATDSTFRGGYFHMGRNQIGGRWRNIRIV